MNKIKKLSYKLHATYLLIPVGEVLFVIFTADPGKRKAHCGPNISCTYMHQFI